MDLCELVDQVRMDLETGLLSDHQIQLYKDLAMRRLRRKILSMATKDDLQQLEPTQQQVSVEERQTFQVQFPDGNQLQTEMEQLESTTIEEKKRLEEDNQLVTFLDDLCKVLEEDSEKYETLLEEIRLTKIPPGVDDPQFSTGCQSDSVDNSNTSTRCDSRPKHHLAISIQRICNPHLQAPLKNLSSAVSCLKSVNCNVRQEMMSLNQRQRSMKERSSSGVNPSRRNEEDNEELTKAESSKPQEELDARNKEALGIQQKLDDHTSHSRTLEDVRGKESQEDRSPVGNVGEQHSLQRIRELELKLKRMEYRARNAEDCCEQLKTELNQRIIDFSETKSKRMNDYSVDSL